MLFFVGVHSGEVSRGGGGYKQGGLWYILGVSLYILGSFLVQSGGFLVCTSLRGLSFRAVLNKKKWELLKDSTSKGYWIATTQRG